MRGLKTPLLGTGKCSPVTPGDQWAVGNRDRGHGTQETQEVLLGRGKSRREHRHSSQRGQRGVVRSCGGGQEVKGADGGPGGKTAACVSSTGALSSAKRMFSNWENED